MTAIQTTQGTPTGVPDDHTPRATGQTLKRAASTDLEAVLADAVTAARWKRTEAEDGGTHLWESPTKNVAAAAIEVGRRLQLHDLTVTFSVHKGRVTPSSSAQLTVEEAPADVSPDWAAEPVSHEWLEINHAGGETYWVDVEAPPQVTGAPTGTPLICTVEKAPECYQSQSTSTTTLSEFKTVDVWPVTTPTWPFGTPDSVSPVPADGGVDQFETNQVVTGDARAVLGDIPANSVDTVFTSPPYRLQRTYSGADSVWGGDPECEHSWETTELYTDTPIRANGGAGFNSSSDPDELRQERWRPSTRCDSCGAWKGELGLEPTLDEYIDNLVTVFDAVGRVLRPDGSLFVNIADSWADGHRTDEGEYRDAPRKSLAGVPPAFEHAMREAGWLVRERYVWVKPSPTPDPAQDRATPAWEYVYRFVQDSDYVDLDAGPRDNVLEVSTSTGDTEHTAMMPTDLPRPLIERATPSDGVVLDPFAGSGSVLVAAAEEDREYIGVEISSEYATIARDRLSDIDCSGSELGGQMSLGAFD